MTETVTILYSPFPSQDSAALAAHALLKAGHVACCNILPAGQSVYPWQGRIETTSEVILLAKTSPAKAPDAAAALATLHPYECPAILTWAASANAPYADWLAKTLAH